MLFRSHVLSYRRLEVVKHLKSPIGQDMDYVNQLALEVRSDKKLPATAADIAAAMVMAQEQFFATTFVQNADRRRYGALQADLKNDFVNGVDRYPETLSKAYKYLTEYQTPPVHHGGDPNESGISFYTPGQQQSRGFDGVRGGGRNINSGGRGRGRGRGNGRYQRRRGRNHEPEADADQYDAHAIDVDIDKDDNNGEASSPYDTSEAVVYFRDYKVEDTSAVLDSGSSVNIFSNKRMLFGIHKCNHTLPVKTIGNQDVELTMQGYLGDYLEPVWYFRDGTANILSLSNVTKHYRVTMDTAESNGFNVDIDEIKTAYFGCERRGIYAAPSNVNKLWSSEATVLLDTVEDIKKQYPNRVYQRAARARKFQNIIMRPNTAKSKKMATTLQHTDP